MIRYERSLRLDEAGDSGAILAYVMNGEPLPIHHGFPLRLIAPSWYAVASVKWLTDIELIGQPFAGHFQMEKYWYEWRRGREDALVTSSMTGDLLLSDHRARQVRLHDPNAQGVEAEELLDIETGVGSL
jgi:DMSO/TMAO reductase YedYZ molybdopterin-dependent catalytic subunit